MLDPRTPVIVGCGQVNGAPPGCVEPIDLIDLAVVRAIDDAAAAAIARRIDLVAVVRSGTRRYGNAAGLLAARRALPGSRTLQADFGGQMAQAALAHVAREIAQGRADAAIVAGGELGSLLRGPVEPAEDDDPTRADEAIGDDIDEWISHPHELALGIRDPVQVYPILETALAWSRGRSIDAQMASTAKLWAGFSEVAARNPFAHEPRRQDAARILAPGPSNRYVGYPYTKLMNSNQFVDQAAALLVCSVAVARSTGIARDRWVFPWAAASAHAAFVSERRHLHEAPMLRRAGRAVERATGRSAGEAELIDLYACFPSAVQIQADALGLASGRPLTLTGGMRFAGGPWNSYALHMLANVVGGLRAAPEAYALCCTNGGFASRFVLGAYSGQPHPRGFQLLAEPFVQSADERRPLEEQPRGEAVIEGFTVVHDRANRPVEGIASCLTPAGARAWAVFHAAAELESLLGLREAGQRVRFGVQGAELAS